MRSRTVTHGHTAHALSHQRHASMASDQIPIHMDGQREEIALIYLDKHGHGAEGRRSGLAYLHRVRQFPSLDFSQDEAFYLKHVVPQATRGLAEQLEGRTFDVVFSPPSSRDDARPYREAIKQRLAPAQDWTDRFRRVADMRAGLSQSCDAVRDATEFTPDPRIGDVRSVLMVDESVATGVTACAMLTLLRQNGLSLEAEFVVAAPLWIVPKPPGEATTKDSGGPLRKRDSGSGTA